MSNEYTGKLQRYYTNHMDIHGISPAESGDSPSYANLVKLEDIATTLTDLKNELRDEYGGRQWGICPYLFHPEISWRTPRNCGII